ASRIGDMGDLRIRQFRGILRVGTTRETDCSDRNDPTTEHLNNSLALAPWSGAPITSIGWTAREKVPGKRPETNSCRTKTADDALDHALAAAPGERKRIEQ